MGRINQKKEGFRSKAHLNWMGGPSYDINNPLVRLRTAAASCFFGEPMYYQRDAEDKRRLSRSGRRSSARSRGHALTDFQLKGLRERLGALDPQEWRSMTPSVLMENAIDAALDHDIEGTLEIADELRNVEHFRTTPQVILVRAAMHKASWHTGLIRKYGRKIIRRADEPAVQLAYFLWRYGEKTPLPNSLKRAWADALSGFNEYQLGKYRMENRGVKTVDVVNLAHPKSDAVNKLVRGELKTTGETWEAIISEKGSTKEAWLEALDKMGHMALLRNLRNLRKVGVEPSVFIPKLVAGAKEGKQFPFRYYSAYKAVESDAPPAVLDAIEECMIESVDNLPQFGGRVMSLCDNSGSAQNETTSALGSMKVSSIGNLTGILTGMASDEGYIGIFGDRLETVPVRKRSSILDQLKNADRIAQGIGESTENGIWLFWDKAIKQREHWDHVFVYSDMQAGHGGLYGIDGSRYRNYIWGGSTRGMYGGHQHIDVPKLISEYRSKVNPNVMVYLVQIAGYQDTIVPEFYNRTFILGGWSDGVIRFAASMSQAFGQQKQASAKAGD